MWKIIIQQKTSGGVTQWHDRGTNDPQYAHEWQARAVAERLNRKWAATRTDPNYILHDVVKIVPKVKPIEGDAGNRRRNEQV